MLLHDSTTGKEIWVLDELVALAIELDKETRVYLLDLTSASHNQNGSQISNRSLYIQVKESSLQVGRMVTNRENP